MAQGGEGYVTDGTADAASRFFMKPSDLGTYLLYDEDAGYLVVEEGPLLPENPVGAVLPYTNELLAGGWAASTARTPG